MADNELPGRIWKSKSQVMDVGSSDVSVSHGRVAVEIGFLRSLPGDGIGIEAKLEITDPDSGPGAAVSGQRNKLTREAVRDIVETLLYVYENGHPPRVEGE